MQPKLKVNLCIINHFCLSAYRYFTSLCSTISGHSIHRTVYTLGKGCRTDNYVTSTVLQQVCEAMGTNVQSNDCEVFFRASVRNEIFNSVAYTRTSKQNSYTVVYNQNTGIGEIEYYVSFKHSETILAVITPFHMMTSPVVSSFACIQDYISMRLGVVDQLNRGSKIVLSAMEICCKCVAMRIGSKLYVSRLANHLHSTSLIK